MNQQEDTGSISFTCTAVSCRWCSKLCLPVVSPALLSQLFMPNKEIYSHYLLKQSYCRLKFKGKIMQINDTILSCKCSAVWPCIVLYFLFCNNFISLMDWGIDLSQHLLHAFSPLKPDLYFCAESTPPLVVHLPGNVTARRGDADRRRWLVRLVDSHSHNSPSVCLNEGQWSHRP